MAIPIQGAVALSTLTNNIVIDSAVVTFGREIFLISADLIWSMRDHNVDEGGIDVGLSHDDLSVAEVAEKLSATSGDPDDRIARERRGRPVRRAGTFAGLLTHEVLNDGRAIRTPLKFRMGDGFALNIWAQNRSGNDLTGSTSILAEGMVYGRWE